MVQLHLRYRRTWYVIPGIVKSSKFLEGFPQRAFHSFHCLMSTILKPGPHKEIYSTATLTICIVTTVFCGGFTERILTVFGMREQSTPNLGSRDTDFDDEPLNLTSLTYKPPIPKVRETQLMQRKRRVKEGIKGVWFRFDENFLKIHFGGEHAPTDDKGDDRMSVDDDEDTSSWPGHCEMGKINRSNRTGETTKTNLARKRTVLEDSDEEIIALTSSFDDE